jgi:N-methylhydantoinase A/oxoprolinase/acetone carboxylase beta subunit
MSATSTPATAGIRVGVDVGGTNTDAVVMREQQVLGSAKHPTTSDVTSGIVGAVQAALADANNNASANSASTPSTNTAASPDCTPAERPLLRAEDVTALMLGTTHFINAVVQRRQLVRVGILRLCSAATRAIPPLSDFPADLAAVIRGPIFLLRGGCDFDGSALSEVSHAEVHAAACALMDADVHEVVVCAVFAPVRSAHEDAVAEMLRQCFAECG